MTGDAEIEKFIQKKLKSGYPAGELRNDLLNKGYSEEEVERLFLNASFKETGKEEQRASKKTEIHVLSLLGASLGITGIALLSTQLWLRSYAPYMIISGVIGLVAGYFISTRERTNKQSP